MKTLEFYGDSDDTFGEYRITGQDCDNCGSGEPIQCIVDCGESGRVMVVGIYSNVAMGSGCWLIGVTKVDYDEQFPEWNFRYKESENSYSPGLMMDLPDDFHLNWYINGRKMDGELEISKGEIDMNNEDLLNKYTDLCMQIQEEYLKEKQDFEYQKILDTELITLKSEIRKRMAD